MENNDHTNVKRRLSSRKSKPSMEALIDQQRIICWTSPQRDRSNYLTSVKLRIHVPKEGKSLSRKHADTKIKTPITAAHSSELSNFSIQTHEGISQHNYSPLPNGVRVGDEVKTGTLYENDEEDNLPLSDLFKIFIPQSFSPEPDGLQHSSMNNTSPESDGLQTPHRSLKANNNPGNFQNTHCPLEMNTNPEPDILQAPHFSSNTDNSAKSDDPQNRHCALEASTNPKPESPQTIHCCSKTCSNPVTFADVRWDGQFCSSDCLITVCRRAFDEFYRQLDCEHEAIS